VSKSYRFLKYQNILDNDSVLYGLERDGWEKTIDGVKFIEVTPDFERALFVRADSLKSVGFTIRDY
jgi:hypothetical protein